jgi:hypothetical protein
MKRYAVFAFDSYDAVGGWNDFIGWVDSPDEAMELNKSIFKYPRDNIQLVSTETWELEWEGG